MGFGVSRLPLDIRHPTFRLCEWWSSNVWNMMSNNPHSEHSSWNRCDMIRARSLSDVCFQCMCVLEDPVEDSRIHPPVEHGALAPASTENPNESIRICWTPGCHDPSPHERPRPGAFRRDPLGRLFLRLTRTKRLTPATAPTPPAAQTGAADASLVARSLFVLGGGVVGQGKRGGEQH